MKATSRYSFVVAPIGWFASLALAAGMGCGGSTASSSSPDAAPDAGAGGADAGAESGTDAACPGVYASGFDQTCVQDSDCLRVVVGSPCDGCTFACGASVGAINASAEAEYSAALGHLPPTTYACGCVVAAEPPPTACCVDGQCRADGACLPDAAVGAACIAAGGTCELGSAMCRQAPQSAQDCLSNPPNPGGGVCCLPSLPAADGAAADGCSDECGAGTPCPSGTSCCSPLPGLPGCRWCGAACPN